VAQGRHLNGADEAQRATMRLFFYLATLFVIYHVILVRLTRFTSQSRSSAQQYSVNYVSMPVANQTRATEGVEVSTRQQ
jgi:hypothetical protein